MKVYNPYNQKEIGEISLSTKKEAEKIVQNAVLVKEKMKKLSSFEKAKILKQIVKKIEINFEEFVLTIVKESGKPYRYAKGEVERAIQTFTIASEECKRIPHELFDIDGTAKGKNLMGEYYYFPKGVVLGISPFNFPLNLVAHKVAPAIAAGCPIILKPSDKTPLTSELLAKIISQTNLPKNGFQVVHCINEVAGYLVEHDEIDVLSFTGSAKVGWELKSKAKRKSVILELGGNAAAIIAEDADLKLAQEELLIGGFAYSGQVCIHTQRIYVHHTLYANFIKEYADKVKSLQKGNPIHQETEIGVLINEESALRIESWVEEAVKSGAKIVLGGKRFDNYYEPTLLTSVSKGQKIREEEVFGPVVIVESYQEIQEAINEVNESNYGLQASIFTNNISLRNEVFDGLKVGAVIHNKSTTFRVDDMPYGGVKNSGLGREGVRYAIKDLLEGKLLVRSR